MNFPSLNYQDPTVLYSNIQTLQEQLPGILYDFKHYYVLYNQSPNNMEYQQYYNNSKSNMNNINAQLFNISNNVDQDIEQLTTFLSTLNADIQKLKTQNNYYVEKLSDIKQHNKSSDVLIDNYKQMYNIDYLRNWGLALSIIGCGFIVKFVFTGNSVN